MNLIFRVSTFPTLFGEKAVRLLDQENSLDMTKLVSHSLIKFHRNISVLEAARHENVHLRYETSR